MTETETELKLIASAATIGESNQPVSVYSTPVASGTPSALSTKANMRFCRIFAIVATESARACAMPRRSPFTKVICAKLGVTRLAVSGVTPKHVALCF